MKIWILTRVGSVPYDQYDGFVVAAESAIEARQIAHEKDPNGAWQSARFSTTRELRIPTKPGVILGSFNAG